MTRSSHPVTRLQVGYSPTSTHVQVPCTMQNEGVRWVTSIFMFAIPGLAGLLAIPAARRAIITKEQLVVITSGIATLKADPQAEVPDPIVGGVVQRLSNAPEAVLADHFTAAEWKRYAQGKPYAQGMRRLRCYLGGRLVLWVLCFFGFVVADIVVAVFASRTASETLLQARMHGRECVRARARVRRGSLYRMGVPVPASRDT